MIHLKIKVIKKNVYGRILYYPDCRLSKDIVGVLELKTFTESQIKFLKSAGWEIEIVLV